MKINILPLILFILFFIAVINTCENCSRLGKIEDKIDLIIEMKNE